MSKHRREVARKIKDDKEKQLEPIQRRTAVRQRAAEQEIVQVVLNTSYKTYWDMLLHSYTTTLW